MSSADFFSKSTFSKNSFRSLSSNLLNSLDTDQAQRFVRPDLGPNCLQRLSPDDASRQRVHDKYQHKFYGTVIVVKVITVASGPRVSNPWYHHNNL